MNRRRRRLGCSLAAAAVAHVVVGAALWRRPPQRAAHAIVDGTRVVLVPWAPSSPGTPASSAPTLAPSSSPVHRTARASPPADPAAVVAPSAGREPQPMTTSAARGPRALPRPAALEPHAPTANADAERVAAIAKRMATVVAPPRTSPAPRVVVTDGDTMLEVAERVLRRLDGRTLVTSSSHGGDVVLLVRQRDGHLRYETAGFTAFVLDDGSVRFEDAAPVGVMPGPLGGNGRSKWQNAVGTDPTLLEVLPSTDEPSPSASFKDVPLVGGTFDPHAPLARLAGEDPYGAEKAAFLAATRDARDAWAVERRARDDERGRRGLEELLARVGDDRTLSDDERRRAILELWLECNDDPVGHAARARIERFVADRMPRGSMRGFGDDELAAFNAGRTARFEPYGGRVVTPASAR